MAVSSAKGGVGKSTVAVNLATEVSANWEERITVSPNPANDRLVIGNATGSVASLMDGTGIEVLQRKIKGSPYKLNVSHLPNGIYYLKIKSSDKETTRKIILAR